MNDIKKGGIVIIDFGSQYTKLIARRIRENLVFLKFCLQIQK